MDNYFVKANTSFIGQTGYNAHARDFFTALSKKIDLKVRNFTVGKTWKGLGITNNNGKYNDPHKDENYMTDYQRNLICEQTIYCNEGNGGRYGAGLCDHEINEGKEYLKKYNQEDIIDIILSETNHHYFYCNEKYKGFKIAYNVWESTLYDDNFFKILKSFDQFWCPSKWQKDCIINQGYPAEKVFVVPEAVDGNIFNPSHFNYNLDLYKDNRIKFLLIGRWEYRKATKEIIETFLKTFKKEEPVDLILVVDNQNSNDGMNSTKERLAHYNFNDDRLKIVNFLERNDYINYLKNGHIFLSCSRSEGWNLPLCIPAGKLIFSNNTFIPIETMKVNDIVISHTGQNQKVLKIFKNLYNDNIIKINLYNDFESLDLTPEHPVYGIKRNKFITKKGKFNNIPNIKPEWIKSKHIEKGDIILRTTIPQNFYENELIDLKDFDNTLLYDDKEVWYKTGFNYKSEQLKYNRFINLHKLSFLFGWYIAEGTDAKSKLIFTLNAQTEIPIAEKIISEMYNLFNANGKYTIKNNTLRLTFCSNILCKFFAFYCNKLSYNKMIPEKILLGPLNVLDELIKNMVLGDGCYINNRYNYTTVSYILARQLIFANQRLNKKTSLQLNKRKRIDKRPCYTLSWSINNENYRHSNKSWWHPEGLAILVKNVYSEKYNNYVYNCEIENDNSYLMSNATVHNCEAMACGTPSIYSNWSGQLEFAEGKGHPVKVLEERAIPNIIGNYIEPDFNDLSEVMRDVYVNYWEYKNKALKESVIIREQFSWDNAANIAVEILDNIPNRTKKFI